MLVAENLTFSYPGIAKNALKNVSFSLNSGSSLGIVGPIGSGKTTLCMMIAGLIPRLTGGDSSGDLSVGELDPRHTSIAETSHQVGIVFEDYAAQITRTRVIDEVMAPLMNRGIAKSEAKEQAYYFLERVGLGNRQLERKRTWELSGGQQQRLAIAATLAMNPQILIFDNATGMLDPEGKEEVRQIIADLTGEKTLIVVEDTADFLIGIVEQVLILVDGEVIANGAADEILRNAELLEQATVEPPLSLRLAKELSLAESPLTSAEFEQAIAASPLSLHQQTGSLSLGKPIVQVEDVTYRVEGVTFSYPDGTRAIDEVDLNVREGEIHAIIGGNGAGKTTLTKLIIGILKPSRGKILIDGIDTRTRSVAELAWQVGTAFQNPDEQISERTVDEEISFPLKRRQYQKTGLFSSRQRYDDAQIRQQVSRVYELVGLETELRDRDPSTLSRGQRKLVTIAAALVLDPALLVLDEPRAGLDWTSRQQLSQMLARLQELGKAIVMVEHDIDFVCEVANSVTVLSQGRTILQGWTADVFARKNWEQLMQVQIRPPRSAQLAQSLGINALTYEDLMTKLAAKREVA